MSAVLPTVLALVSTTTFTTMNLTLNHVAFPSYLLPLLPSPSSRSPSSRSFQEYESSPALLLRQWTLTYSRGHFIGPATVLLSTFLFLYFSFLFPELAWWYRFAALSAFIPFPYTAVWLLPVNDRLYAIGEELEQRVRKGEVDGLGETEGEEVIRLIGRCLRLSRLRAVMSVPALGAGLWCVYVLRGR
ncbi:Hypothetical protein D9617_14g075990 [Elsinoe fawcettii]|nr:Hypothetical protein D9617_14g075990 [Elsinoe fawcettii]